MSGVPPSRKAELEQQLAYLRWCRLSNERQIRNDLEVSRVMQQNDTVLKLSVDHAAERSKWMHDVIKDEISRPLVLSDAEIHKIQKESEVVKKRLLQNAKRSKGAVDISISHVEKRADWELGDASLKLKHEKLRRLNRVGERIMTNALEASKRRPIVHSKWNGHDSDLRAQVRNNQATYRRSKAVGGHVISASSNYQTI